MSQFKNSDFLSIHTNAPSVTTGQSLPVLPDHYHVVARSGIALDQTQSWNSELAALNEPTPLSAVRDLLGEWLALARRQIANKYEFLAFTDHSGFGTLFYAHIPYKMIILADSFHGVVRGLEHHASPRSLDIENYLTALSLPGAQFRTKFSARTMANEIRVLEPGWMMLISDDNVSLLPRSLTQGASTLVSYENAIHRGLAYTEKLLHQLPELMGGGAFTHLSGGVDSRLIFAMIDAFGLAQKYPVHSGDPRDVHNQASKRVILEDIRIADHLRSEYHFEWWTKRERRSIPLAFLDHLHSFQSFRSNISFQYSPGLSKSKLTHPQVSLRGGGGEMLRTTGGAETISTQHKKRTDDSNTLDWLLAYYMKGIIGSPETKQIVSNHLTRLIRNTQSDTLQECLNKLYFTTRNQAHFGHMRQSLSGNDLPVHILSNPYFLRASELLDSQARHQGQLVEDLFLYLDRSEMLKIPFESPFRSKHVTDGVIPVDDTSWSNALDSVMRQVPSNALPHQRRFNTAEGLSHAQLVDSASNFVILGMNLISSMDRSHTKILDAFHKTIVNRLTNKRIALGPLVAKVAAALDIYFPSAHSGTSLTFSTSNNSGRPHGFPQSSLNGNLSMSAVFGQSSIMHEPKITIYQSQVIAEANPMGDAPEQVEFAFYLKLNGKKINERWYTSSSVADFTLTNETGHLTVESFIRLKHSRGVPLRKSSEAIEIINARAAREA